MSGSTYTALIVFLSSVVQIWTDDVCSGDGVAPHPSDCTKYYLCDNGGMSTRDCPVGMRFNPKHGVCDFARNVKCKIGRSQTGSLLRLDQERLYRRQPNNPKGSMDTNSRFLYSVNPADKDDNIRTQSVANDRYDTRKPVPRSNPGDRSKGHQNFNGLQRIGYQQKDNVNDPYDPQDPVYRNPSVNGRKRLPTFGDASGDRRQDRYSQRQTEEEYGTIGTPDETCSKDGYYPYPGDCSKFKQCAAGMAYILSCPPDTFFDPGTRVCGHSTSGCSSGSGTGSDRRDSKLDFLEREPNYQLNYNTDNERNQRNFPNQKRNDYTQDRQESVSLYTPDPNGKFENPNSADFSSNLHTYPPEPPSNIPQLDVVYPQGQARHPQPPVDVHFSQDPQELPVPIFTSEDEMMGQIQRFIKDEIPVVKERMKNLLKEEAMRAKLIKPRRSAFSAVQDFLGSTTYAKQLSLPAFIQLQGIKVIKKRFQLNKFGTQVLMRRFQTLLRRRGNRFNPRVKPPTPNVDFCPFEPNTEENECDPRARYRNIDGSCNNLKRPLWGKSFRPLARFLQPDYSDGVEEVRKSKSGELLPSARLISNMLFEEEENIDPVRTVMHMTFGQLLDHDIGRTAVTKLATNESGSGTLVDVTCGESACETTGIENRACFPIPVPEDDPDFSGKECLQFVRTQESLEDDCSLSHREQLNQLTSWLDGSLVYGSTEQQMEDLRDRAYPNRGRMKVTPNLDPDKKALLPQKSNPACRDVNETIECFIAGDGRVNEQIGLVALHTILLRLHNDIEEKLFILNPHWDGERLFQQTKKILAALWQHIVYNEYVPTVLGPAELKKYGLELHNYGYFEGYDPSVNGDATNSFQTAAFRFGHSQISSLIRFASQKFKEFNELKFSTVFRRPFEVYNNERPGGSGVDSISIGMISQPTDATDRFFSEQVTSRLFSENPPEMPGTDLPAINTQRGRDHGLPGYNEWRTWCGLKPAKNFDDLVDIPEKTRRKFKKIYDYIEDVDLFPAGVAENHVPGGVVGPTFACIIARQFRNLRVGDRFWYERNDPLVGFTEEQLAEIRKITFAKVMCQTLDKVKTIQKFVMIQPFSEAFKNLGDRFYTEAYSIASLYKGERNERRPCYQLEEVDLTKWKERHEGNRKDFFTI